MFLSGGKKPEKREVGRISISSYYPLIIINPVTTLKTTYNLIRGGKT